MKAIWDNIRAVDLLAVAARSRPGAHRRASAIRWAGTTRCSRRRSSRGSRSSCRAAASRASSKDDLPSWTGKVYMPRIASVTATTRRRCRSISRRSSRPSRRGRSWPVPPKQDDDFEVSGVRDCLACRPADLRAVWQRGSSRRLLSRQQARFSGGRTQSGLRVPGAAFEGDATIAKVRSRSGLIGSVLLPVLFHLSAHFGLLGKSILKHLKSGVSDWPSRPVGFAR